LTGHRSAAYGRLVFNDAGINIDRCGGDQHRSLETLEDVQLEQAIEAVRRGRVETKRAEEGVKEFGFRRIVLLIVLGILGLVAVGSIAVIMTGIVSGIYSLAAGAVVPLSGSGGLSVLAWRTYAESLRAGSKPS
jgi:hypothetical protein